MVKLRYIVEESGVSIPAVSLVLNKKAQKYIPGSSAGELVSIAAKERNYRPDELARDLRFNKTYITGLIESLFSI
jgi:DNA-binding LacI/PurR family transcriptional regulator